MSLLRRHPKGAAQAPADGPLVRIEIDLNVRTRGNMTFACMYRDVSGPITEGQPVEVYESESGVFGPGRVVEINRKNGLVYLAVEWPALRCPDDDD